MQTYNVETSATSETCKHHYKHITFTTKNIYRFTYRIESVKTTSMESVSTGVLGKNIEHNLRSGNKAKKYDILRHILSYMSKYK